MDDFWGNFAIEMGLLTFLGVLYYLYQKKKILGYEANKAPLLMNIVLEAMLAERGDKSHPDLDPAIEAIDDFLTQKSSAPPIALLTHLSKSESCTPELRNVIQNVLDELK